MEIVQICLPPAPTVSGNHKFKWFQDDALLKKKN